MTEEAPPPEAPPTGPSDGGCALLANLEQLLTCADRLAAPDCSESEAAALRLTAKALDILSARLEVSASTPTNAAACTSLAFVLLQHPSLGREAGILSDLFHVPSILRFSVTDEALAAYVSSALRHSSPFQRERASSVWSALVAVPELHLEIVCLAASSFTEAVQRTVPLLDVAALRVLGRLSDRLEACSYRRSEERCLVVRQPPGAPVPPALAAVSAALANTAGLIDALLTVLHHSLTRAETGQTWQTWHTSHANESTQTDEVTVEEEAQWEWTELEQEEIHEKCLRYLDHPILADSDNTECPYSLVRDACAALDCCTHTMDAWSAGQRSSAVDACVRLLKFDEQPDLTRMGRSILVALTDERTSPSSAGRWMDLVRSNAVPTILAATFDIEPYFSPWLPHGLTMRFLLAAQHAHKHAAPVAATEQPFVHRASVVLKLCPDGVGHPREQLASQMAVFNSVVVTHLLSQHRGSLKALCGFIEWERQCLWHNRHVPLTTPSRRISVFKFLSLSCRLPDIASACLLHPRWLVASLVRCTTAASLCPSSEQRPANPTLQQEADSALFVLLRSWAGAENSFLLATSCGDAALTAALTCATLSPWVPHLGAVLCQPTFAGGVEGGAARLLCRALLEEAAVLTALDAREAADATKRALFRFESLGFALGTLAEEAFTVLDSSVPPKKPLFHIAVRETNPLKVGSAFRWRRRNGDHHEQGGVKRKAMESDDEAAATEPPPSVLTREDVGLPFPGCTVFVVGGVDVPVLGLIMQRVSPVLREALLLAGDGPSAQPSVLLATPAGMSPQEHHRHFLQCVEFAYTGRVQPLRPEDEVNLWRLANLLAMESLQSYCNARLERRLHLSPGSVAELWELGQSHCCRELESLCARSLLSQLLTAPQAAVAEASVGATAGGHHALEQANVKALKGGAARLAELAASRGPALGAALEAEVREALRILFE